MLCRPTPQGQHPGRVWLQGRRRHAAAACEAASCRQASAHHVRMVVTTHLPTVYHGCVAHCCSSGACACPPPPSPAAPASHPGGGPGGRPAHHHHRLGVQGHCQQRAQRGWGRQRARVVLVGNALVLLFGTSRCRPALLALCQPLCAHQRLAAPHLPPSRQATASSSSSTAAPWTCPRPPRP